MVLINICVKYVLDKYIFLEQKRFYSRSCKSFALNQSIIVIQPFAGFKELTKSIRKKGDKLVEDNHPYLMKISIAVISNILHAHFTVYMSIFPLSIG